MTDPNDVPQSGRDGPAVAACRSDLIGIINESGMGCDISLEALLDRLDRIGGIE